MKQGVFLVTGCGGDIGTSVGRILKDLGVARTVVGCDLSNENAGKFVFDACESVPRADDPEYLSGLETVVNKYTVDAVFPISEGEIRFFHKNGIRKLAGVPLVLANDQAIGVGLDKLLTNRFLEANDLPHPWTHIAKEHGPEKLPCIMKSRFGHGSKDVQVVTDDASVAYFGARRPEYIWQEYLSPDDEEYTCGLYGCADGSVRHIIFRRTLVGGLTGSGEVVENSEIKKVLIAVAQSVNLRGSINVQLRLTGKGPMIFEINPRFSSTVAFRHKLGFNDVLWALEEVLGLPVSPYVAPREGVKFYRGYTQHIES